MPNTSLPEVTTSPFERSHGNKPRGFGSWAFQASNTRTAFDRDVVGEMFFVDGAAFGEAKHLAALHFRDDARFVAVLP